MQKIMSDYLDSVCNSVRGNELRDMARVELSDHINERYGDLLEEGMDEEKAALETIRRMGEPDVLGKKITAANRSYMSWIYALIGLALFVITMMFMISLGGELGMFIDIPSMLAVTGLSAACGLLYCGRRFNLRKFLQGAKMGAIHAGGLGAAVGVLIVLNNMAEDPENIGVALAVALISLMYGLLLSVALRIAESKISTPAPEEIRKLFE